MKFFTVVIQIFVALMFDANADACIEGVPKTIFSKSFSGSNSVLTLTSQCFGKPTYLLQDFSPSSLLALNRWLINQKKEKLFSPQENAKNHAWDSWLTTEFVLPSGTATDSLYMLMLRQNGHQETVWNIKILNTHLSVGVPPAPFFVDDAFYQNNTAWIFYWKEPSYYLDRQEKQRGKWVNTASLRFDRPYQLGVHFSIFLDRDKIGVKSILKGETEEYWRVEGDRLVLQEVK